MSDFDREAERERLREKYEQDQKEREATERMSELLLQGATMTNAHCSACGDPIFRYEGQEFCATCERPVERDGDGDGDESEAGGDVEVTTPGEDTRVVFGGDGESPDERTDRATRTGTEHGTGETAAATNETAGAAGREETPTQSEPAPAPETAPAGEQGDASIEATRASLRRTLAAFSRRAEATDDPGRAREHLQAAREAAEVLAVLGR